MSEGTPEPELLVEIDDGVALLTLNRPAALNALTLGMLDDLRRHIETFDREPQVRCVILTGAGDKAFSAGVDLKELAGGSPILDHSSGQAPGPGLIAAMAGCSKPIIAAVNGFAVTGGFELVLACDFVYASSTARFADTHARVGLLPEWGLSQKLSRLVGINRAREISFTGDYFSAAEAEVWGLVNRLFEPQDLLPGALETARRIAETVPEALFRIKRLMNDGWEMPLAEALELERAQALPFNTAVDFSVMQERLKQLRARKP